MCFGWRNVSIGYDYETGLFSRQSCIYGRSPVSSHLGIIVWLVLGNFVYVAYRLAKGKESGYDRCIYILS